MEKVTKLLPVEITSQIFGYLNLAEWQKLRLVSRQWNDLCQPLAWQKVAIVPAHGMERFFIDPVLAHDPDFPEVGGVIDLKQSFAVITYQQLQKLASDQQFQNAVANYTTELSVHYRYTDGNESATEENAHAFETIAELFKRVITVRVSYTLSIRNDAFLAFQRMLDKWKPTAEFYLGLITNELKGDRAYIDIEGMNIRELYLSKRNQDDGYDSDDDFEYARVWVDGDLVDPAELARQLPSNVPLREFLRVPLSQTGKSPISWVELACVSKDLTRLSISTDSNNFQSLSVPDTVKHLHVSNFKTTNFDRSKLTVSRGVEYLYVTDYCDFVRKRERSVFAWLDLTQATQLKSLQYAGPELPSTLEKAVIEVEGSLESLSVTYLKKKSNGPARFKPLASRGLGIKQLRVLVADVNRNKGDYESYIGTYPELEQLELDLFPFDTTSPDNRRYIKTLLARFLRGCPKLARAQLCSQNKLKSAQEWMEWVSPGKFGRDMVHEINLSKFRATVM
ncbi:hypothetical protein TRVA0_020S00628 [Trichomonascus vanleenenianus]|uniref:F-box protein n=1 Tax=Trichomonascus vanleenenianus TaxID=2268995 RepID=UPI003ECB61FA